MPLQLLQKYRQLLINCTITLKAYVSFLFLCYSSDQNLLFSKLINLRTNILRNILFVSLTHNCPGQMLLCWCLCSKFLQRTGFPQHPAPAPPSGRQHPASPGTHLDEFAKPLGSFGVHSAVCSGNIHRKYKDKRPQQQV